MKITIGGTIGFKITAKPYEPININTTFMYEHDKDEMLSDKEVDTFNEKVNKQLEIQLKKKAAIALKVYKELKKNLEKFINS